MSEDLAKIAEESETAGRQFKQSGRIASDDELRFAAERQADKYASKEAKDAARTAFILGYNNA